MDEAMSIGDLIKKRIKRTAVFRVLQLGDMLCAVPAVRAFKKYFPDSEITLIGLPWAVDFARRFSHYFNDFIAFPGYAGLVEQPFAPGKFEAFLREMQKRDFDLLIQMHGNGTVTNEVIGKIDAKMKAGFRHEDDRAHDELFMPYPEGISEIERHMRLMRFLGVSGQDDSLEFPITRDEETRLRELYTGFGLKSPEYVCIHPGARDEKRRWPPELFARVADTVVECGFKAVLTGTSAEAEVVAEVEHCMKHASVNLAGRTNIGVLAGLIKNSRLLFCNDTGVSHIAAALATPSIIVFLASDPVRWAPLDRQRHRAILPHEAANIDLVLSRVRQRLSGGCFDKNSLKVVA